MYLIELSNGMEVKVDAQTGEVLGSTELFEPSPAVTLFNSKTTVPLEQAVRVALQHQARQSCSGGKIVGRRRKRICLHY